MKSRHAFFLIAVVFAGILSVSSAVSQLTNYVIIPSTGRISASVPRAYKSEIRGVFVTLATWGAGADNWTKIAENCHASGINLVVMEGVTSGGWYGVGSDMSYGDQIGQALTACHSYGIPLWVSMNVLLGSYNTTVACVKSTGEIDSGWTNPSNPISQGWLKQIVQGVLTTYPAIDGFNFDYIRFDAADVSYDNYSRDAFYADTGRTDLNWPSDVVPTGPYYNIFMDWRRTAITNLVRDMRSWMLAVNPNLKFSATVYAPFASVNLGFWPYWIAQDVADWVTKGYLDMVNPMIYTNETDPSEDYSVQNYLNLSSAVMTGGYHGKVPIVPFISDCGGGGIFGGISTSNFADIVNITRTFGASGFVVWAYGGPGDAYGLPDIANYMGNLTLPQQLNFTNIQLSNINATAAQITWVSSQAANGAVEYNSTSMFSESSIYNGAGQTHFSIVVYTQGVFQNETSPVTSHSITLTGLSQNTVYHYRIFNVNENGTSFSVESTFTSK